MTGLLHPLPAGWMWSLGGDELCCGEEAQQNPKLVLAAGPPGGPWRPPGLPAVGHGVVGHGPVGLEGKAYACPASQKFG